MQNEISFSARLDLLSTIDFCLWHARSNVESLHAALDISYWVISFDGDSLRILLPGSGPFWRTPENLKMVETREKLAFLRSWQNLEHRRYPSNHSKGFGLRIWLQSFSPECIAKAWWLHFMQTIFQWFELLLWSPGIQNLARIYLLVSQSTNAGQKFLLVGLYQEIREAAEFEKESGSRPVILQEFSLTTRTLNWPALFSLIAIKNPKVLNSS